MLIAGLQKLTLIDYPGKIAATVFIYGCNFFCSFCHNPELVKNEVNDVLRQTQDKLQLWKGLARIDENDFFDFLKSRQGLLEGVCLTGGEPTLYEDLRGFISQIKNLGFLIKLDTNGTNPQMIKDLIDRKLIDYLAMDIKAPLNRYEEIVRRKVDLAKIKESIKIIMEFGHQASQEEALQQRCLRNQKQRGESGGSPIGKASRRIFLSGSGQVFDYEFRTTLVPEFHEAKDVEEMAKLIRGAKNYYLQNFVSFGKILEPTWVNKRSFTEREMKEFQEIAAPFVEKCEIRI